MTTRGFTALGLLVLLVGLVVWALLARGTQNDDESMPRRTAPGVPASAEMRLSGTSEAAPVAEPALLREPSSASPLPGPRDRRRLQGLVVDASGQPIPNVEVRLANHHGEGLGARPGGIGRATTDEAGRYLLVTPTPGTYGAVARLDGYGTGWTGPVEVRGPNPVEAPVLQVRGEGHFSGVVVFPDGQPAAGVPVWGGVDRRRGGNVDWSPHPGLVSIHTRTDARGRFSIRGLRPGPYAARVKGARTAPRRIEPASGTTDARFVLLERHLHVLLRDAEGRPLEGARLRRANLARTSTSSTRPPGGEVSYFGEGGEGFVLCVGDGRGLPHEQEVAIPKDAWTREVILTPRPRDGSVGRLQVRVSDDARQVVSRWRVTLRTPHTGLPIPWLKDARPDADGFVHDVPPGTWTLSVEPLLEEASVHHEFLFTARARVEVKAEITTPVDVVCRRGGRIRVTSLWPEGVSQEQVEATEFDLEGEGAEPRGSLRPDPDEPQLGPRLDPGPWVVVVHGEGVKTQRVPVEVLPGRIVDVTLRIALESP